MDPNCNNAVDAYCQQFSTETGIYFRFKSTGELLRGTRVTERDCETNTVVSVQYTSDAGTAYISSHVEWVDDSPETQNAYLSARTASGGGSSDGLTDEQLRAAPVPVTGPLTDAQLRATSVPTVDGNIHLRLGNTTEAVATTDTAASGLNGLLKRALGHLTSILGRLPTALGQQASTNSLPVVLASNQPTLPTADSALATNTGAPSNTVATTDTGTFGIIPLIKRALQHLTTLHDRIPVAGVKIQAFNPNWASTRQLDVTASAANTFFNGLPGEAVRVHNSGPNETAILIGTSPLSTLTMDNGLRMLPNSVEVFRLKTADDRIAFIGPAAGNKIIFTVGESA